MGEAGKVLRAVQVLDHVVDPARAAIVSGGEAGHVFLKDGAVGAASTQGLWDHCRIDPGSFCQCGGLGHGHEVQAAEDLVDQLRRLPCAGAAHAGPLEATLDSMVCASATFGRAALHQGQSPGRGFGDAAGEGAVDPAQALGFGVFGEGFGCLGVDRGHVDDEGAAGCALSDATAENGRADDAGGR